MSSKKYFLVSIQEVQVEAKGNTYKWFEGVDVNEDGTGELPSDGLTQGETVLVKGKLAHSDLQLATITSIDGTKAGFKKGGVIKRQS